MPLDYTELWKDLDTTGYAVLALAQQEYASKGDRFENFRKIATLCGLSVRHVILIFLTKHLISIEKGVSLREDMKGRYVDVMNYLRLLYAWDIEEGGKNVS